MPHLTLPALLLTFCHAIARCGRRRIALLLFLSAASTHPALAGTADELRALGAKVSETDGQVVSVNVNADNFTEADWRTLGSTASLRSLTIDARTLDDSTLPLLAGLTQLETLSTNRSQLTDDGYRHFAAFKNLRSLSLFHPSWSSKAFTGAGLAHLKNLPKLERLIYAGSTASDDAFAALAQVTQLKEFSTWHTYQTQAAHEHLTKLPALRSLKMGQRLPSAKKEPPSFDATSIPVLARIATLERFDVFEGVFTADDFLPFQKHPKLKTLAFATTEISASEIEKLRALLPGVTIELKPLTPSEREDILVKKLRLLPSANPPKS